jgi:hypothetical protein
MIIYYLILLRIIKTPTITPAKKVVKRIRINAGIVNVSIKYVCIILVYYK